MDSKSINTEKVKGETQKEGRRRMDLVSCWCSLVMLRIATAYSFGRFYIRFL